jgi:hypothetical protein
MKDKPTWRIYLHETENGETRWHYYGYRFSKAEAQARALNVQELRAELLGSVPEILIVAPGEPKPTNAQKSQEV